MKEYFDVIISAEKGRNSSFHQAYEIDSALVQKDDLKQYLGDSNKKICRFCGKDSAQTKFKMKAHIIPEFMGNKFCFSYFECDDCNQYFGTLEDSLFNLGGIHNVFSGVKGKKGFPKYKGNKENLTLFAKSQNNIRVQSNKGENSETFAYDREKERVFVETNQHSFIPQNAFKALVKIGLCMINANELDNYKETLKWISSINTTENENNPFFNVFMKIGGNIRLSKPIAILFKKRKKNTLENIPEHTLLISHGIIKYQIFLPFHKNENKVVTNNKLVLPIEEHLITDTIENNKITGFKIFKENLTGIEKTKERKHIFSFGFKENKL